MKRLVVGFLLWSFFGNTLWAQWRQSEQVMLAKDEPEQLLVKTDTARRLLEFRWTLYTDDTLVVLKSFDERVSQHLLRRNHVNQAFRIPLMAYSATKVKVPYLLIRFSDFDYKKNEARFDIHLQDDDAEVLLEFVKREE